MNFFSFDRIPRMSRSRMMNKAVQSAVPLLFFLFCSAAYLQAQEDILRAALQKIGRDSSNIGFKPQSTWGLASTKDEFRLPYFDDLLASPLKIPLFSKEMM